MTVNDDVTVCIKAFERPACLRRAIESVRDYYPDVRILVADDSERPPRMPGVDTIILPFDTGLSFGRNRMMEHVRTPLLFLMEDDAYFCEETDLEELVDIMERTDFDILGMTTVEMPDGMAHPPGYRLFIRGDQGFSVHGPCGEEAGCELYDFVTNIFMARTARLRWFKGWDEQFKMCEHRDFFLRAKGRLKVACKPDLCVLHHHIEDERYRLFRRGARPRHFWQLFLDKHGIHEWHNNLDPLREWATL